MRFAVQLAEISQGCTVRTPGWQQIVKHMGPLAGSGHDFPSGCSRSVQYIFTSSGTLTSVEVMPGDICVIIRPEESRQETDIVCVLVASLVRHGIGQTAERLIWIKVPSDDESRSVGLTELAVANVTRLSEWRSDSRPFPGIASKRGGSNIGFLKTGERYVVYRIALYADRFKQHKSLAVARSVGGCYMMPFGLSLESRRTVAAARVLTLAPHGQNLNDAIDIVIDDVVNAALYGVEGVNPYGRRVRIFIDPVAFFGDYPAVAATADVMDHTADAFCTLCAMKRRTSDSSPEILYSAEIHSRRLGYMRIEERMRAIRESGPDGVLMQKLGIRCSSMAATCKLPTAKLSEKLRMSTNMETTESGQPVFQAMFDSHMSAAAVPDHLLTGLTKNVLTLCFEELHSDKNREEVERRIMSCVTQNGLPVQGNVLRWGKSGKCKGLLGLTMTGLLCVLLCAAPVFRQEFSRTGNAVFLLPEKLQNLGLYVFRWPVKETDSALQVRPQSRERVLRYQRDINAAGRQFVQAAAAICRTHGERAKVLDKPNAHRAVELCVHTIPNFGHARNCSEMVLEMAHRTFKDWLEINTHKDSHLTAVERAIARDWLGRIFALYSCWVFGGRQERECAEVGLRRLFLGSEGLELDETCRETAEFLSEFREEMRECFREPVMTQLRECGYVNLPWCQRFEWEVVFRERYLSPQGHHEEGLRLLNQSFSVRENMGSNGFDMFRKARYVSVEKYGGRPRAYPHNTVREGDAISAIVSGDLGEAIVPTREDGEGVQELFVVFGIAKGKDGEVWGLVKKLEATGEGMSCSKSSLRMLRFGGGVRRIALVHVCDSGCKFSREENVAVHSASAMEG